MKNTVVIDLETSSTSRCSAPLQRAAEVSHLEIHYPVYCGIEVPYGIKSPTTLKSLRASNIFITSFKNHSPSLSDNLSL